METTEEITPSDKEKLKRLREWVGTNNENRVDFDEIMVKTILKTDERRKEVGYWLREMEEKGHLILVSRGGGRGKFNRYTIFPTETEANPIYTLNKGLDDRFYRKTLREWVKQNRKNLKAILGRVGTDGKRKQLYTMTSK